MKIVSWNVNGIRSVAGKGFLDYLRAEAPDFIGLQEVRAEANQNPVEAEIRALGYDIVWNASSAKKGYAGTAWLVRHAPDDVHYGIGMPECDPEGRVLTLEYADRYLLNVYTPNSGRELARLAERQIWDRKFGEYVLSLQEKKPVVFLGDLNVAHEPIDLANPAANRKNAGFTDEERAGFRSYVSAGLVDTFRALYPDLAGQYTWWSNFGNSRARNVGWRIDYVVISPDLLPNLRSAFIRPEVFGSDHCPVGVEMD